MILCLNYDVSETCLKKIWEFDSYLGQSFFDLPLSLYYSILVPLYLFKVRNCEVRLSLEVHLPSLFNRQVIVSIQVEMMTHQGFCIISSNCITYNSSKIFAKGMKMDYPPTILVYAVQF